MAKLDIDDEQTQTQLIEKALMSRKNGDLWMAKSWFLTGAALYPKSFRIQFERYLLAKQERNLPDASKYFCELLANVDAGHFAPFEQEQRLIVAAATATVNNEDEGHKFLILLFNSLKSESQYALLSRVIQTINGNWPELCRLMLYTLKLFPGKLKEEGSKLIEIISMAEGSDSKSADNYRRMLIFEVLPLILSEQSNFEFESFNQLEWNLLNAFQYYVNHSSITLSDTNQSAMTFSEKLQEKLNEVMLATAIKQKWNPQLFESDDSVLDYCNEYLKKKTGSDTAPDAPMDLSSGSTQLQPAMLEEQSLKELAYSLLFLFLKCLNRYAKEISEKCVLVEKYIPGLPSANQNNVALPAKKRKLLTPTLPSPQTPRELITNNESLKRAFNCAIGIGELLDSNAILKKEFNRMLSLIGVREKRANANFNIDEKFYRGQYEELISLSKEIAEREKKNLSPALQIMSASLITYDNQSALQHALHVVELLSTVDLPEPPKQSLVKARAKSIDGQPPITRQLYFVELNRRDILSFCVETLIACFKSIILASIKPSDTGLGHLIVLSQYNWPQHVKLLAQVIEVIRAPLANMPTGRSSAQAQPHKFIYPAFLDYVVNPNIIEEFMALTGEERLVLELSNTGSTSKTPTKSMTTRGVNKGAKDELRAALTQQMQKATAVLDDSIFIDFTLKVMKPTLSQYF